MVLTILTPYQEALDTMDNLYRLFGYQVMNDAIAHCFITGNPNKAQPDPSWIEGLETYV